MKYFLAIFSAIIIVLVLVFLQKHTSQIPSFSQHTTPTPSKQTPTMITSTVLFVPYWTMDRNSFADTYSSVIYFGLHPTENGDIAKDQAYQNLSQFSKLSGNGRQTMVTIVMTDPTINEHVLQDTSLQKIVADNAVSLAKEYGFSGVVLDFEYNALAFPSVVSSITNFSQIFLEEAHNRQLLFYQTLYGDTFYLGRPYDVQKIGQGADGIFVMAYDFHKANGTPGPNFPTERGVDADYDFSQMVEDFLEKVVPQKITITFGMFGYDWPVDDKGRSVRPAESFTTAQFTQKYLAHCQEKNCHITATSSKEKQVTYEDLTGQRHEIWLEDMSSVEVKKTILEQKGISSIGFWAYGYF